ncbi:hypothetical protein N7493_003298 [Penicillium malachiteum]|uniref:Uncharacterized protein n=1 Tax=Penicillium malachiteum TaxID=1324776 RepID=A0AAD6HPY4_9EURO|nr:hypothetical protein N7493_003298 [Penicillium malachiteum]
MYLCSSWEVLRRLYILWASLLFSSSQKMRSTDKILLSSVSHDFPLSTVSNDDHLATYNPQENFPDLKSPNRSESFPYVDTNSLGDANGIYQENSVGYTPIFYAYDNLTDNAGALPKGTTDNFTDNFNLNDMSLMSETLSNSFTSVPATAISDIHGASSNDQSVFKIHGPIANTDSGDDVPKQATVKAFERYT